RKRRTRRSSHRPLEVSTVASISWIPNAEESWGRTEVNSCNFRRFTTVTS
ncbi:hypothetical protein MRX96_035516, partial [Rhipicephalus microplus]